MYFTDRKAQWPAFDKVRREIWKTDPPVTTGVSVDQLEQDAQVEIEAISVIPNT
jgi:enamine deaminase RidA (YjgF/YER057c/UK114 family)